MWQWSALVAMACFAAMQLLFRQLSRRGIETSAILLLVFAFAALLYLLHVAVTRTPLPTGLPVVALLAGAAALSYVGNLFSVRAVATAPNPGYAVALVSLQAAVVTIAALGVAGATLSWVKLLGVILCCGGIALLVI
jgi:drug/metabolite transporter (DMT)-like permease